MNKKAILMVAGLVVLVGGWYLFRPELLFVNQSVNETLPGATLATTAGRTGPQALAVGRFHGVAHEGAGVATLYQLPGGQRVLRLTEFSTSNGPALHVYLVAAADATDNDTVKKSGFVDLGPLKGNQGDQNYDVPAGTDLDRYRAVTIWCQRFNVNFATAPLAPATSEPRALARGHFHGVAHEGQGAATVYELAGGQRVLRLTELSTSNGPALHVYLVAAADATDSDSVKKSGFVDLGPLKGNQGDQNYDVPAGTDLDRYRAVTIWCQRFSVNFATAPLSR
jgi:hypothetical protein